MHSKIKESGQPVNQLNNYNINEQFFNSNLIYLIIINNNLRNKLVPM